MARRQQPSPQPIGLMMTRRTGKQKRARKQTAKRRAYRARRKARDAEHKSQTT
jgi:hypothetical protein